MSHLQINYANTDCNSLLNNDQRNVTSILLLVYEMFQSNFNQFNSYNLL